MVISSHSRLIAIAVVLFVVAGCSTSDWVPLSVVKRDSAVGGGKVLIITNTSDSPLHENVIEIHAPNGKKFGPLCYSVTLGPHETIEIGWAELNGWMIEKGETVYLSSKGYLTKRAIKID